MKRARAARKLKAKRRVTAIATAVALREGQETAKMQREMLQRIALVIGRSVASRIARRKVAKERRKPQWHQAVAAARSLHSWQ